MMQARLSVIIPALNEADILGELLDALARQQSVSLEVIVADGGSTDRTRDIAEERGAVFVVSEKGRGRQMNRGAAQARADWLLFLHADSRLTRDDQLAGALAFLQTFLQARPGPAAGRFPLEFDTGDPEVKALLRFFEAKTRLDRPGVFNGDQGLLIRKRDFLLAGSFPERLAFLEDQEFAARFEAGGEFVRLPSTLVTSARRFEQEGARERIILNAIIMAMHQLEHPEFFHRAGAIYREHSRSGKPALHSFFALAQESVFDEGIARGARRCQVVGRYAIRNLWQAFLWLGLRRGNQEAMLGIHDRYVRPVLDNPPGHAIGAFVLVVWFLAKKLSLGRKSP